MLALSLFLLSSSARVGIMVPFPLLHAGEPGVWFGLFF